MTNKAYRRPHLPDAAPQNVRFAHLADASLAMAAAFWLGVMFLIPPHTAAAPKKPAKRSGTERPPFQVTFARDAAPIIFKKCAPCHFPGGPAPFSLTDYADAKKHASAIAAATQHRSMPPWLAAPGYAKFVGERGRTLTNQELQTIQRWVKQGAPEGDLSELPPLSKFSRWPLGKPDLILKLAHPYTLPAHGMNGRNVMRNFVIPVPIQKTRYVKALILHPGPDRKLFFHSNILYDPTGLYRLHASDMGQPGFMGMSLEVESDHFNPEGHFLLWKAGTAPAAQIDGMPWRLKRGSALVVNMHMIPDGKPHKIQPVIGLYFTDKPPTKHPMLIELHNTQAINISPGDGRFLVTDQVTLSLDVEVFAVYPHAHYLGKTLEGYAILPDGKKERLLRIPDWNPEWTAVFRYTKPVFLPKGTSIHMHFVYDNSADNPRNPNHPPKRVVGGDQATDDMAEFWLQVLPVHTKNLAVDPRLVLQETMMRHDLAMNPRDPLALSNLAAALEAEGKPEEAEKYYRQELQARPGDAPVETALGGILQAQGNIEGAVQRYRAALRTSPKYVNAHYNLGIILLTQGKFGEAAEQFRDVLAFNPDDGSSHNDLGSALASQGKWREAVLEFRHALQLNPQNADAHDNLGYILARQGELRQAVAHFEKAVRLKPHSADFHDDLANALLQRGMAAQAVGQFERALQIDPQDSTARLGLQKARTMLSRAN